MLPVDNSSMENAETASKPNCASEWPRAFQPFGRRLAVGARGGQVIRSVGIAVGLGFVLALTLPVTASAESSRARALRLEQEKAQDVPTEPAVAAPNIRFGIHYDFLRQDKTDTFAALTTSSLTLSEHEGHSTSAEIVGTVPIVGPLGARAMIRGAIGHQQRSLDGLERGNNEISKLGVGAQLFLRDPKVGSITVGGGWDRLARDGPIDAEEFKGDAAFSIFYPDLGMGPVDWTLSFEFAHRQVSDVPGTADVDADRYVVTGQAGWYASDDVQIALGARWERAEEEFSSAEDTEGFVQVRWWLARSLPVELPIELTFGGSVGVSEYKLSPFRADNRMVYGANVGLVFRFGSGETLLDAVRRFD